MAGMQPHKESDGMWMYPSSKEVLETAGLYIVSYYIEVRRQTILDFIVNCPIFQLCTDVVRLRGTSNRQYWWEQLMDLGAAKTSLADSDASDVTGP